MQKTLAKWTSRLSEYIYRLILEFGFDILKFASTLRGVFPFFVDLAIFLLHKDKNSRFFASNPKFIIHPSFSDRYQLVGVSNRTYDAMNYWALSRVHEISPFNMLDFGSHFSGFIIPASLACKHITLLDVRKIKTFLPNVTTLQRDILIPDFSAKPEFNFISCLHVLEHIGLGRYGDKVNPDGPFIALKNILDYASFKADVLLAVPVGRETIEFNSQRIFSAPFFIEVCNDLGLRLQSFSLIDDNKSLCEDIDPHMSTSNYKSTGLFHFRYLP